SVGYSGTEQYTEAGLTDNPYNQPLSTTGASGCSAFATLTTGTNDPTNGTPFTAAATVANPTAGECTITVTDNLTDQTNPLPTFVVTYTTVSIGTNSRHHK